MAKPRESTPAVKARKEQNARVNDARRAANTQYLVDNRVPGRDTVKTKVRHAKDGKAHDIVVTKAVRPSKLIRTDRRAIARVKATHEVAQATAKVAAAAASAHPAE